jgi:hypothetical protein
VTKFLPPTFMEVNPFHLWARTRGHNFSLFWQCRSWLAGNGEIYRASTCR